MDNFGFWLESAKTYQTPPCKWKFLFMDNFGFWLESAKTCTEDISFLFAIGRLHFTVVFQTVHGFCGCKENEKA